MGKVKVDVECPMCKGSGLTQKLFDGYTEGEQHPTDPDHRMVQVGPGIAVWCGHGNRKDDVLYIRRGHYFIESDINWKKVVKTLLAERS